VTAWGTLGENASNSLHKGARILVSGRLEQRSWETQEGDKRSVVEVVADEIGPSLRWATVEITKNERREGGESSGGGGGSSRPASNEPAPAYSGGDEEPF
jgi:single-strand DNA-binding protein